MVGIILWSLLLSLAINGVMFVVAFKLQSDKLTDISYALSFIILAFFAFHYSPKTLYAAISVSLVCLWAVRIGSFLLYRVLQTGSDRRFDGMRDHFWKFGKFWLGQAVTVWILMIPLTLSRSENSHWHAAAVIGIIVWLIGLVLESIADLQKYHFTHKLENKNTWIDEGVWRYSRHPNYFGEMLVWFGIFIYALPDLTMIERVISLVSPLFISVLLLFVSGIPILEKNADKRWGTIPAYKAYKRRTSSLIPLPRK